MGKGEESPSHDLWNKAMQIPYRVMAGMANVPPPKERAKALGRGGIIWYCKHMKIETCIEICIYR